MTNPKTPLLGCVGTLATFELPGIVREVAHFFGQLSLAEWNQAVGLVAGVLTVAYLVRQHVHFRRDKRK